MSSGRGTKLRGDLRTRPDVASRAPSFDVSAVQRVHVVHDVDRDGLGAAAMMCAQLGPERVRLHPTKAKDVRPLLHDLEGETYVLDIGAPPSWDAVPSAMHITWVDHHLAAWTRPPPPNIAAVLPPTSKPTVTMALLVKSGLVDLPDVIHRFVGKLCGGDPEFGWGAVFDAMTRRFPKWDVELGDLPALLAEGPRGKPVPPPLRRFLHESHRTRNVVEAVLDNATTRVLDHAVVAEVPDARRIPLAQYSLALQRRHPGKASVLVHRGQRLYCGRDSGRDGVDFVQHFRRRGFAAKGHPYVVTIDIGRSKLEAELQAVLTAIRECA